MKQLKQWIQTVFETEKRIKSYVDDFASFTLVKREFHIREPKSRKFPRFWDPVLAGRPSV